MVFLSKLSLIVGLTTTNNAQSNGTTCCFCTCTYGVHALVRMNSAYKTAMKRPAFEIDKRMIK